MQAETKITAEAVAVHAPLDPRDREYGSAVPCPNQEAE